ncbi:MAG: glycosyltransferase [Aromatoleum sp.]|jgi:glycosyltransferase involved in cell wall biosynthesis|uniref:glycosyltransferase n=1 Tax=Aromatoleum sp. TaxID=2307007 RepID=UPI002894068B|nr:glycosyltransferase [Aromatoleum sp.]MDT3670433.1 glycosyltransferase [Aromatoleum sp.]
MTRRVKVLQLQPDYNVKRYGFADLAEQIVLSLPAERFEVVSAYLAGRPEPGGPVSRAERAVHFGFSDAELKGARVGVARELFRFCRTERFDVVICNRWKTISLMLLLNKRLRIPACIAIVHGVSDYDRLSRRLHVRALVDERWRFVGVSPAVRQALLDARCGLGPHNAHAITNAIDIDEATDLLLARDDARRTLGIAPDARVVGTIGRQVPVKGYLHLVRAFARVAGRFPDVVLVLIGAGRQSGELRDEVRRLGIEDRVVLPGTVPDALRFLRAFDLWAMPSLEEGFPLALLEAMAAGLPVIASDIPSMRDLVAGAGGALVPPADDVALADALAEHLVLPREGLVDKGASAHAYLRAHHAIGRYRRAYRDAIEGALARVAEGTE